MFFGCLVSSLLLACCHTFNCIGLFLFMAQILFHLLNSAPFSESEQGVAQAILRGLIDFKRDPWPNISESAKSLVRQMLEPDPKLRLTAKQVLGILSDL